MNTVEKLTGKDVRELYEADIIGKKEARVAAGFPAYENETAMVRKLADELYKTFEPDMEEKEFKSTIVTVWHSLFTKQPPLPLEEPEEPQAGKTVIVQGDGTVVGANDSKTPAEVQAELEAEDPELRNQAAVPFEPQPLEQEVVHPSGRRERPVARPTEPVAAEQA